MGITDLEMTCMKGQSMMGTLSHLPASLLDSGCNVHLNLLDVSFPSPAFWIDIIWRTLMQQRITYQSLTQEEEEGNKMKQNVGSNVFSDVFMF